MWTLAWNKMLFLCCYWLIALINKLSSYLLIQVKPPSRWTRCLGSEATKTKCHLSITLYVIKRLFVSHSMSIFTSRIKIIVCTKSHRWIHFSPVVRKIPQRNETKICYMKKKYEEKKVNTDRNSIATETDFANKFSIIPMKPLPCILQVSNFGWFVFIFENVYKFHYFFSVVREEKQNNAKNWHLYLALRQILCWDILNWNLGTLYISLKLRAELNL